MCKIIANDNRITSTEFGLAKSFQEPSLDSNGVEIKEPLDTIFVKSVRESGPAHLAGLQCGEYIVRAKLVNWPHLSRNPVVGDDVVDRTVVRPREGGGIRECARLS